MIFPIEFNGFLRFRESMLRGKIDLGGSWRPLGGVVEASEGVLEASGGILEPSYKRLEASWRRLEALGGVK